MKKYLRPATHAFILLATLATVNAQSQEQPRNEIEVRGAYSIPSGETNFSATGSSGSTIDFSRDFDFSNELGYQLRYTHKSENGKHKLLADYGATTWERSTTLSRSFTFLGETYVANLSTSADLKLRVFRAMYSYRWGNDKIRIGPMADLGVIATRINITGTTNNGVRSREGSISKFAATVGYDLDYDPIPEVNIFHNLGAIAFKKDRLFHAEGGVKYFPARNFGVTAGYRYQRYKLVDDPDFLTIGSHGPFFGGIVRF